MKRLVHSPKFTVTFLPAAGWPGANPLCSRVCRLLIGQAAHECVFWPVQACTVLDAHNPSWPLRVKYDPFAAQPTSVGTAHSSTSKVYAEISLCFPLCYPGIVLNVFVLRSHSLFRLSGHACTRLTLSPPTTRLCTSWYRSTVAPLWRPGTFGTFKMLPNSALCPPLLLSAQDTQGKPLTVTNTTTSLKTYYGYIRHPKLPCKQPSHALSSSTYTETHISRVKCPHLAHWRPPTRC